MGNNGNGVKCPHCGSGDKEYGRVYGSQADLDRHIRKAHAQAFGYR